MANGILNVNKPRGMASFAVVSLVRRLTGVRRVGHAGTLDPIADGVLPICLGHATRVVEYLVDAPKAYHATVRLGVTTDTYDSEGAVIASAEPGGVTLEDVEEALPHFAGEIRQLPPMFSALKHAGRPLYRYARAGKTAPRQERTVAVHRLDLRSFASPLLELELECGRGAYVRTLAHDFGQRLGCGAHLTALTRLRSGPFALEEAVDLDTLQAAQGEAWQELLYSTDRVLESWHAALLGEQHSVEVRQGRLLTAPLTREELIHLPVDTPCRAYSSEGEFLAILRYQGAGRWHPEKVFAAL